ncbi:hypothetical protein [Burkholderia oklahomensis]|nr:hypothetical protein [Burkholderia oklahomensis]MBI0362543.1 hypothetical protein [Burkholderia oklahomensis]
MKRVDRDSFSVGRTVIGFAAGRRAVFAKRSAAAEHAAGAAGRDVVRRA